MRVIYVSQFGDMVGRGEYSLLDLMADLPKNIEPVLVVSSEGIFTDKAKSNNVHHVTLPMPPLKQTKISTLSQWRKAIKVLKPDILHANNLWAFRQVLKQEPISYSAWLWLPWVRMVMGLATDVGRIQAWGES